MKRLCICLCIVLLALTACGRAQPALVSESVTAATETTTQIRTLFGADGTESAQSAAEAPEETQTEPVTTEARRETQPEPTAPPAATATTAQTTVRTTVQTTRETHTLFPIPVRTTRAGTTVAGTTTTTRPTTAATTATTRQTTTTTTTTQPAGGHVPSVQPANTTTAAARKTCTVTIDCRELRDRPEKLKTPEKAAFVPKSGYIVKDVTMEFKDGESAYDVLRRLCATHTCTDNCRFCQAEGIQMESTYTPQFDNYYVEGIHQLYEKDCGGTSGWTYWVNGEFLNYGSSSYIVKPGDRIVWVYSIEMDANETFE